VIGCIAVKHENYSARLRQLLSPVCLQHLIKDLSDEHDKLLTNVDHEPNSMKSLKDWFTAVLTVIKALA
jgi:hypothetical protein